MMDITKLKSVEDLANVCNGERTYFDHELLAINFAVANLEKFRQLAIQDYVDTLELVKLDEWIKCSDRLPEENIEVLIYDDDNDCMEVASYNDGAFNTYELIRTDLESISHWMPLPNPPQ